LFHEDAGGLTKLMWFFIEYPDKSEIQSPQLRFYPESLFINFNYTDTLEELYGIPKSNILYLHNNANDYSGDLIFGHAKKEEKDPKGDDLYWYEIRFLGA